MPSLGKRSKNPVFGAACLNLAISKNKKPVGNRHDLGPMRNKEDGLALLFHEHDGLHQGLLANVVQVGIGLIEHHKPRVAIDGSGQGNALALPAR